MQVSFNVMDYLKRAAFVCGTRCAITDEPGAQGSLGTITYRELLALANGMAAELDRLGVGVGERVAIVSPNAAKFLVALFGVSGSGRMLVPINYRLNAGEVDYIVQHSGASVLLIDAALEESLANITCQHKVILDGVHDADLFTPVDELPRWEPEDENFVASVNYTSGTTARPKGVRLTHRNCWLNAMAMGWHLGISDRDVYLHTLPTFHCNGWGIPYAVTAMGCHQVIIRKIDGENILARIEQYGVTLLCGAPTVVSLILQAAESRRANGREIPGKGRVRMVVAGAPPPSVVIEQVETLLGWEFIQLYGLTETSPLVAFNRAPREWDGLEPAERARLLSLAGPPGIGVALRTDDNGEVMTRSNYVFDGYWEQPKETADVVKGGWFHTGDAGVVSDAYLTIMDRKKDIIITGGENVSSIEVENCLYQHESVAEACVIGVPHDKWGETVKALVVRRPDRSLDEQTLISFCRERLAHYKCPTSVEFRESLQRTATGKLQKYRMRQSYWDEDKPS